MTGSKQAVGYLVLVFLLGAALGTGGGYWFASNELVEASKKQKASKKPSTVDWLIKELDLTPEQKTQFHGILDETRETYDSIRRMEVRPRYDAARQAGREKIRAILNEEQRAKFDDLVRHLDEKEKKRREKRKK